MGCGTTPLCACIYSYIYHEWDSGLKVQWGSEIQRSDCSLCIFNWDRRQNTCEV